MTQVQVRPASAGDGAALARLRRAWVEETAGPVDDGGRFEAEFADWLDAEGDRRLTWLAMTDDAAAPVGMVNVAEFRRMPRPGRAPSSWGYLGNAFVVAAHRNRGVGRALLAAAVAEARRRRYARLVLSPTERARPFYLRAGFAAADELLVLRLD